MTTRERWIVYPLLFLALGVALRDKLVPPDPLRAYAIKVHEIDCDGVIKCDGLNARQAECGELKSVLTTTRVATVIGPGGDDGVRLGFVEGRGGQIEVCGQGGKVVALVGADRDGRTGLVETAKPDEEPR